MPSSMEIMQRLHNIGDVVALRLFKGGGARLYPLRIISVERPNDLQNYSLGTASALNATGTEWDNIEDSNQNRYLEPEHEEVLHQVYWGVSPSYIWVYRRYPSNVDRGSLFGTRTVGGSVGYITGRQSPIGSHSALTETYVIKGQRPSYLGYHPFAEPTTPTVFMSFSIFVYGVEVAKLEDLTAIERAKMKVVSPGGLIPVEAPSWISK